jgi:4'-phosphopantetheinyl transferase
MIRWISRGEETLFTHKETRVYRSHLQSDEKELTYLASILSTDEQQRADCFVFGHDRDYFVKARGILRLLLAGLLNVKPQDIRLSAGPFGKPCLAPDAGYPPLKFNLAHSHGLALYALCFDQEIGIDTEKVRTDSGTFLNVSEYFSPVERTKIADAPESRKAELFFLCWVMKEAYAKARGEGLQIPLHEIRLPSGWESLGEGEISSLGGWGILPFRPDPEYVAAVSVEGEVATPSFWSWD